MTTGYFPDLLPEFNLYAGDPWLPWPWDARPHFDLEYVRLHQGGEAWAYVRRGWGCRANWGCFQVGPVPSRWKALGYAKALFGVAWWRLTGRFPEVIW